MSDFDMISEAYNRWRAQYTEASFRWAAVLREGQPTLLRGALRFSRHSEETDTIEDYGKLILRSVPLKPDAALRMIRNILEGEPIPDLDLVIPTKFKVKSASPYEDLPSPSHMRGWDNDWPGLVAILEPRETAVNEPRGPLVKASLPLAVTPRDAINRWTGLDPDRISDLHRGVGVILPDFRCRISRILVAERSTKVEVESSIPEDQLVLKAGARYEGQSGELHPERRGKGFVVPTPEGFPASLDVFLLDGEADEVLDWQEFYIGWTELPRNVGFEAPEQHVGYLVEAGESVTLEYKELIRPGEWGRVMEDVVAMANTQGGRILVGVSDDAEVQGVVDHFPSEDDLARALREWVNPYVECGSSEIEVQSRRIIMIDVPEGPQKPYFHRERGPLVRRGSNNYPMPREEVLGHGRSSW